MANRVDDWAGRNIAETKTATRSYAVRLSYGRARDGLADHLHSVMLFASDMQRFVKRLRSRRFGYKVRYMIAGEYGSTFGRAHWHGIFHFYGDRLPDWDGDYMNWTDEQWQRVGGVHIPEWAFDDGTPIGHVHIKPASYASVRYALKYMLKDQDDPENAVKVLMSKYPPLGTDYLTGVAREIALAGLAPRDLFYRFPVVNYAGANLVKDFLMRGKVAELFVRAYVDEWKRLYGDRPHPSTGDPDTDPVGVYLRFGRLGRSEFLTINDVENREADARFAKMEAEAMRPPGWLDHLTKTDKGRYSDVWNGLRAWERKYFGEEKGQRKGEGWAPELNSKLVLSYLCWRYQRTEREFWARPYDVIDAEWRAAERDFRAAVQAREQGEFGWR